jgi:hypothetical protein
VQRDREDAVADLVPYLRIGHVHAPIQFRSLMRPRGPTLSAALRMH